MPGAALALQMFASCLVTQQAAVSLEGREVFAADLVDRSGGACAGNPEQRGPVVAMVAVPGLRASLPRTQLVATLRKHVPGIDVTCGSPETCAGLVTFVVRSEAGAGTSCARLVNRKGEGAIIAPGDAVPVACEPGPVAAGLAFDEDSGVLRAAVSLEAGTYLGRVRPVAPPERLAGEAVTVTSLAGVVRVDQAAILLQPARPGAAAFVQTASGAVLSVEVPPAQEAAP